MLIDIDSETRHAGQVVTREQILSQLYESEADVASNVVEVLVCSLRKKIQPAGAPPIIVTRRGRGYLIESPSEADSS